MGNAAAEGLNQALPDKGGDFDIIVLGLQESTYVVRRGSSTEKDERAEPVLRPLMSNDGSDCASNSECDVTDNVKTDAALDAAEHVSNTSNVSETGKDTNPLQEACVMQLQNDITSILKEDFYLVTQLTSPSLAQVHTYQVQYNRRGQMQQLCYARQSLRPHISAVEISAENTGFFHVFPNKGGLGMSLAVDGTKLFFISCHLAAHECRIRNDSIREIFEGVRAGDINVDPMMQMHHVFLFGDLNYRLTFDKRTPLDTRPERRRSSDVNLPSTTPVTPMPTEDLNRMESVDDPTRPDAAEYELTPDREQQLIQVLKLVAEKKWSTLLEMDEFIREIAAGRILSGFSSLVPNFPPTFKRKRHQSLSDILDKVGAELYSKPEPDDPISSIYYDMKRMPSYTDRIVYKSLPGWEDKLNVESFVSSEDTLSSDHKPVIGSFTITTTGGSKDIVAGRCSTQLLHRRAPAMILRLSNIKAKNLSEMDSQLFGGGSDPYVIIKTLPHELQFERHKTIRSKTIRHELNPEWKETIEIKLASADIEGMSRNAHLQLSVWDFDRANADDLIGACVLPMRQIFEALYRDRVYHFDTQLYSNGLLHGSISGTIELQPQRQGSVAEPLAEGGEHVMSLHEMQSEEGLVTQNLGCGCVIA